MNLHDVNLDAPSSSNGIIVTYPLDFVPLGIGDVQRPPMDPGVTSGRDGQTQALQPRLLRLIVCERYLEGDVVNCGGCGIETSITGTGRPVEQCEDLSMTPVSIGDPEEDGFIGLSHQLQANDVLVEPLHGIEVGDPQGDLAQSFDRSFLVKHERSLLKG